MASKYNGQDRIVNGVEATCRVASRIVKAKMLRPGFEFF